MDLVRDVFAMAGGLNTVIVSSSAAGCSARWKSGQLEERWKPRRNHKVTAAHFSIATRSTAGSTLVYSSIFVFIRRLHREVAHVAASIAAWSTTGNSVSLRG